MEDICWRIIWYIFITFTCYLEIWYIQQSDRYAQRVYLGNVVNPKQRSEWNSEQGWDEASVTSSVTQRGKEILGLSFSLVATVEGVIEMMQKSTNFPWDFVVRKKYWKQCNLDPDYMLGFVGRWIILSILECYRQEIWDPTNGLLDIQTIGFYFLTQHLESVQVHYIIDALACLGEITAAGGAWWSFRQRGHSIVLALGTVLYRNPTHYSTQELCDLGAPW